MQKPTPYKPKRCLGLLTFEQTTYRELDERIKNVKDFIEKHQTRNESYHTYLANLIVERTSRIGKKNAK